MKRFFGKIWVKTPDVDKDHWRKISEWLIENREKLGYKEIQQHKKRVKLPEGVIIIDNGSKFEAEPPMTFKSLIEEAEANLALISAKDPKNQEAWDLLCSIAGEEIKEN